jgi:hypothetical protein
MREDADLWAGVALTFDAYLRTLAQFEGPSEVPYDPGNPGEFAEILKKLAKRGLSSDKAVELWRFRRPRTRAEGDLPIPELTRATLNRFRNGDNVRATAALRQLWSILEAHDDYADVFPKVGEPAASLSPEVALAAALKNYFSEDTQAAVRLNLDVIQKRMRGIYTAYRPTWRIPGGYIMTTRMELLDDSEGRSVFEFQNFAESDLYTAHVQKDAGFLFSFGKYTYFLMGGTGGDTTLKLWVVEVIEPNDQSVPVSYFFGTLYTVGPERPYAAVPFFCKRKTADSDIVCEYLDPGGIEDKQVRRHFKKDN